MAAPITHVVYGLKAVEKLFSNKKFDKKKFFIGTLFPDIRYLGEGKRNETHLKEQELSEKLDNSFFLGMHIHVLVDLEREKTIKKLGIYNLLKFEPINIYALKFIEDKINYVRYHDWELIRWYLNIITQEEIEIAPKTSGIWHKILRHYLSDAPLVDKIERFAKSLNFDSKLVYQIKKRVDELQNNKQVLRIVERTYSEIFS